MIPMSELVRDPAYRKFLQTVPRTPLISRDKTKMMTPPWVVYIQKEPHGSWGKRSFWKYSKAFKFLAKALKMGVADAALNNKRIGFEPPSKLVRVKGKYQLDSRGKKRQVTKLMVWKPPLQAEDEDHHWCKYCRRPTVFKYYKRHRALKNQDLDTTVPRCCICGASARIAIDRVTDKSLRVL